MENSVEHKIHQIQRITGSNGKSEYRGRTYAKNEVVLQPGCTRDAFDLLGLEFYKLVTTVITDDDSLNIYTIPV